MSWLTQVQQLPSFLEAHVFFDIALGIVIFMLIVSVIFRAVNSPSRVLKDTSVMAAIRTLNNEQENSDQRGQVDKLWEFFLNETDIFNERQNFFLLFESILLGGTFSVFDVASTNKLVLAAAAFLGLFTTITWWYIQVRHKYVIDTLREFQMQLMPAFETLINRVRLRPYRVTSTSLLVYILPILVGLLWALVLIYA